MRLSLDKKSHTSGPVGLDLDGRYLAAVHAEDGIVKSAHSMDLPPGLLSDGEVRDVAGLTEAIKEFSKRHRIPKRVRLGVSNQQVAVRQVELPLIDDPVDRVAAVRFQAGEAIAMPLEEAMLDYQVIGDGVGPDGSTRLRVIVVAARETMIARLLEAVRGAGLTPEGIDLDAFALVRMLADSDELGYDRARVFCHLGGVTNLAIAVGNSCLFARPLSAVVDDEDAEHIAGSLAEEIRLSIDYYLGQPEAPGVGDVLLSGPGSRVEGLPEHLSALIDLPVEVAEPLGRLTVEGLGEGEDPTRHTVAAGLAMGAAA